MATAPEHPSSSRSPRLVRRLVWAALSITAGLWAFLETPREIARWYFAAASHQYEAGRHDAAQQSLDNARQWDPDNLVLILKQVQWHKAKGDYAAALADLDRADAMAPGNTRVQIMRAEVLQHLKRHAEAIDIWKLIDRISRASGQPPRESALNGLAYARAVGNLEVAAGVEEANQALELAADKPSIIPAILDTRGFLLYRQGKYEAALRDMEPAVKEFEEILKQARMPPSTGERVMGYSDLDEPRLEFAKLGAAVVRYHRSLVLEKVGRHAEAKVDRLRAKQLIGREPDETLF